MSQTAMDQSALKTQLKDTYELERAKFIISRSCRFFEKDAMEPAPLFDMSLLDYGCGEAFVASYLVCRGADVTAFDICPSALNKAKDYAKMMGLPIRFMEGDISPLFEEERRFDIGLCLDFVDMMTDEKLREHLSQMRNLLQDKAILFISHCHASEAPFTAWQQSAQEIMQDTPEKQRPHPSFNEHALQKILSELGFKPYDHRHLTLEENNPNWMRSENDGMVYLAAYTL